MIFNEFLGPVNLFEAYVFFINKLRQVFIND